MLKRDKEDEMLLEGDEEDELVLEGDKEKERSDLQNGNNCTLWCISFTLTCMCTFLPTHPSTSNTHTHTHTHTTDEELRRLQKVLAEFSFEISQLQSQFDSMQREKSVLQSKAIEMERMHIQMKEGMSLEISYLCKLQPAACGTTDER